MLDESNVECILTLQSGPNSRVKSTRCPMVQHTTHGPDAPPVFRIRVPASELRAISGSEDRNAVRWLPAPMVTHCDTPFAQCVTRARGAPIAGSMLHAWHRLEIALARLMGAG